MKRNNIKRILAAVGVAMLLSPIFITAQIHKQKGVVRKITNSAQSPIVPVKNVKVMVGNRVSNPTSPDGRFTMDVPKEFEITGVSAAEQYILALPTKGKKYTFSPNDVDVIVTTKEQKEAVSKEIYDRQCAKYKEKIKELQEARDLASSRARELKKAGEDYKLLEQQRDSLQNLLMDYTNEFTRFEERIDELAEELAITDYMSLNEKERKLYELRTSGDWDAVSHFYLDIMKGDPKGQLEKVEETLLKAKEIHSQSEEMLQQALAQREETYKDMLGFIESLKMRHLNDSVSFYYKILTDADPTNWEYLNAAGLFENDYMVNSDKAMDYHQRALNTNPTDSLLAITYNNFGAVYLGLDDYEKALEYLEKALGIDLQVFGENHPDVATSYNNIGVVYNGLGNYEKSLEYYEKALKVRLHVLGENHPDVASSYNNIGGVYSKLSDYEKALEYHEKAFKIRVQTLGENHPEVATSYNNIGFVYYKLGNYEKALKYYEKALKIKLRVFGENHPTVATSYNNIGVAYADLGNYDKALEDYETALQIQLQIFGENHLTVATSYINIGVEYNKLGAFDRALEYYEKALQIQLQVLGEYHPDVATSYNNVGSVYEDLGNYEKALEYHEKALKISVHTLGENHPDVASSYLNIGIVYNKLCKYEKSLEYYEKALKVRLHVLGENHPDVATLYNNIGVLYDDLGNYEKALEYHEKALQIQLLIFDENHPSVATSYNNIGVAYADLENYDKASEYYEKALEIKLQVLGENHPDVATSHLNIGEISKGLGNYDKALENYEKASRILVPILGEGHPNAELAKTNLRGCKYKIAVNGQDKEFLRKLIIKGTVAEGWEASKRGLTGEYYILEYEDWSIDSMDKDVFEIINLLRGKPKDLVLYKDGEIIKEHFDDVVGIQIEINDIAPESKAKIIDEYHIWKTTN